MEEPADDISVGSSHTAMPDEEEEVAGMSLDPHIYDDPTAINSLFSIPTYCPSNDADCDLCARLDWPGSPIAFLIDCELKDGTHTYAIWLFNDHTAGRHEWGAPDALSAICDDTGKQPDELSYIHIYVTSNVAAASLWHNEDASTGT